MENNFVPYDLAVKLKKLGFNEECFRGYGSDGEISDYTSSFKNYNDSLFINAPLWQQAFDWFRKEHKLKVGIGINDKGLYYNYKIVEFNTIKQHYGEFKTYEEARLKCLEKLIEICEKN